MPRKYGILDRLIVSKYHKVSRKNFPFLFVHDASHLSIMLNGAIKSIFCQHEIDSNPDILFGYRVSFSWPFAVNIIILD